MTEVIDMTELPLVVVAGGLVGLGVLALVMGAVLSSVADLLALLPGRWSDRSDARVRGVTDRGKGRTDPGCDDSSH